MSRDNKMYFFFFYNFIYNVTNQFRWMVYVSIKALIFSIEGQIYLVEEVLSTAWNCTEPETSNRKQTS